MAGPWRPSDTVDKYLYVAFQPLRRLAGARLAGHSEGNVRSGAIWAVTEENIP